MAILETRKKLDGIEKQLNVIVFGREKTVKGLILALASNEHIMIQGKHGEGKSYLVKKLSEITNLKTYYKQLHNETQLKEVVGMINPIAFQKGKLDIIKTSFWDSNILFFDEFLRGRSEFLDFLLEVMIERECSKTVLGAVKVPIISVIATTNPLTEEYNTERLDLALKDRFSFIINFDHLIEERPEMLDRVIGSSDNEKVKPIKLTPKELQDFREYALKNIESNPALIKELGLRLKDMGFSFSSRFLKKVYQIAKVNALLGGRTKTVAEDYFAVCGVMFRNRFTNLNDSKITTALDDTIILLDHRDTVEKIEKLKKTENVTVFIEKTIELLGDTKEEYEDFPPKLKKMIDSLRSHLKLELKSNLNIITPKLMKSLDTEEFKQEVSDFIKSNTVETTWFLKKDESKLKPLLSKVKSCEIEKKEDKDFIKYIFKPTINKISSFRETKTIMDFILERDLTSFKSRLK